MVGVHWLSSFVVLQLCTFSTGTHIIEESWSTGLSATHAALVGIAAPASMVGVSAGGDEPELTADAGRSTAWVWDFPLDHGSLTDWKCLWEYTIALAQMNCFEWTPLPCMHSRAQ